MADLIGTVVADARWVANDSGEWHRREGAGDRKPKTVWAQTHCGQEGLWKHDAQVPPPGATVCDDCARPVLAVLTATGYAATEVMAVLACECGELRPVNVAVIPAPPDFEGTVLEWQRLLQDLAEDVMVVDDEPTEEDDPEDADEEEDAPE